MAKIAELKKYLGYEFSSGCYTGEDYKSFQTKYINYLKTMCSEKPLAARQCRKKPLLLLRLYKERGKQVRVYIHFGRALLHERMVQQYPYPYGKRRTGLPRRLQPLYNAGKP